ncbi:hypothetical protein [Rosistilla oblonga]|uniref:hypothetical protein n=1 Tax=Rosistilla oblonga TaxID=2527990 RepID=UPI003A979C08
MKAPLKRSSSRRLRLEQLEGRWMLSANPLTLASDDLGYRGGQGDGFSDTQIVDGGSRDRGPRDAAAQEGNDRGGLESRDSGDREDSRSGRLDDQRPGGERRGGDRNGDRPPPRRDRGSSDGTPTITDNDQSSTTLPNVVNVTIRTETSSTSIGDSTSPIRTPVVSSSGPGVDASPAVPGLSGEQGDLGPMPSDVDGVSETVLVSVTPQGELWELSPESFNQVFEAESETFANPSTVEAIEAVDQWLNQSDAFRDQIEQLDQAIEDLAEEDPAAEPGAFELHEGTELQPDTAAEAVPPESNSQQWLLETSGLLLENDSSSRTVADPQSPRSGESIANAGWNVGIGVFKAFESVLPAAPQRSLSAALLPTVATPPRIPSPVEPTAESDSQRSLAWYEGASLAVITIAGVVYVRRSRAEAVRNPADFV